MAYSRICAIGHGSAELWSVGSDFDQSDLTLVGQGNVAWSLDEHATARRAYSCDDQRMPYPYIFLGGFAQDRPPGFEGFDGYIASANDRLKLIRL